MFGPDLRQPNRVIYFCINGRHFYALASDKLTDWHFTGDTQCLPLYRYTAEGQRVSNVTEWGLRQFREHYGDDSITAEDIFAYVYAVLHDPAYRQRYEVDLRREFPRLHFQDDFAWWAQQGQALLDLHLGFESAEPYPLERAESGLPGRPILRADKERGSITLDGKTTLTGIPESAWRYRLGSRSALEWVLDQYKERKPRDPTIAEKFNTYRFADYKEQVIDLLARVCTVSVATIKIVDYELDVWTNIDPDEGLEFKEEFLQEMERRLASNEPTIPAEEVYRRLGLV
jgi:predicted helicase